MRNMDGARLCKNRYKLAVTTYFMPVPMNCWCCDRCWDVAGSHHVLWCPRLFRRLENHKILWGAWLYWQPTFPLGHYNDSNVDIAFVNEWHRCIRIGHLQHSTLCEGINRSSLDRFLGMLWMNCIAVLEVFFSCFFSSFSRIWMFRYENSDVQRHCYSYGTTITLSIIALRQRSHVADNKTVYFNSQLRN